MTRTFDDRLARLRDDDRGFALVFVLLVSMMIMAGTATTLAVTTSNIKPGRHDQDAAAALAAAQAGVQRYVAMLNATCPTTIAHCTAVDPATGGLGAVLGSQKFQVSVVNPGNGSAAGYQSSPNDGALFVTSTGTSPVSPAGVPSKRDSVTRTITARLSGKPSPLSLAYFSNYETVGSAFLNSYYGARRIAISKPSVLAGLGVKAASATAQWNGPGAVATSGTSDNICDKLWYDDPSNATGGTSALGRANLKVARPTLTPGTDYSETGTLTPLLGAASPYTRTAPCETTFTSGQTFSGPVYSRDAFYLSSGKPGGAGPKFSVPAGEALPALWTGWTAAKLPAAPVAPYRSFPVIGGSPAAGSGAASTSPFAGLSLPTTANLTAGTCTFRGPTKVSLSGSSAQVTSPLTSSPGATCPATVSGGAWNVPVTTTTIYVQNASSAVSSMAFLGLTSPSTDLTYYSPSLGDAYVSGTLTTGKLSLVSDDDIVVTGNVLAGHTSPDGAQPATTDPANGERAWKPGTAAVDLVATNNVRVYHPVSCVTGSASYGPTGSATPSAATPNGWCPNDITGLYATTQAKIVVNPDGSLQDTHPAKQYANILTSTSRPAEIDAAVFALNGAFSTDNFDRGSDLGTLIVNGGVYQNHHGPLGQEWETPSKASARDNSGYRLQLTYLSYTHAGLGYVPALSGGTALNPWQVVSISSGGTRTTP